MVVLKTKASHSGKGSAGDFKASHRVYRPAIDELLAGENLSIKLQPIIHLMSKEVVAVEAFAFLETRNGQQAVAEIVSSMSDEQLCLTDRIIVKRLGGIARKMESDGQLLPIHYTFVSMKVARHPTWSKICNMLKADAKLAKVLVPQISMALFRRLDEREMTRFLEFKEFGAKPCITECQGVKTIVQMATQHRISMLKLTVSELLSYTHKEGERVADSLLPQLARVGVETVATHVEKAHQAANLIDLDLSLAQGDFISPARSLKGENSQSPRPSADISG